MKVDQESQYVWFGVNGGEGRGRGREEIFLI
jgi:hypothetical protein